MNIVNTYILPYLPTLIEAVISAIVIGLMKAVKTHAERIETYKESTSKDLERTVKEFSTAIAEVKSMQAALTGLAPELLESTKALEAANRKAAKLDKKVVELEALVRRKGGDSDDAEV